MYIYTYMHMHIHIYVTYMNMYQCVCVYMCIRIICARMTNTHLIHSTYMTMIPRRNQYAYTLSWHVRVAVCDILY